ncbi:hypothetical protein AQJ46_19995 [Streptomyces canus]|uniref:Knr4/Smi1-like domain-containing protein n=1 Tax=Streptomyces canus TaxID=58343 RepID=A0A117R3D3_9ACTN|nr:MULTISPECIES: hypothetical protein [Streptomyces]KUN68846.1 hypothetical protein AQJ46_19995 [Streptomyces canus]MDI5911131.1 hypothetical protein [Streptomyces sp. 12257]
MTDDPDRPEDTMHWAVEELGRVMRPPAGGGDTVDWEALRAETGWELPVDYRDFVAVYGLGAIGDSIGILTPAFGGYPYEDHLLHGTEWPPEDGTLTWASNEAGDDFLWTCVGEPDEWRVVFRPRNRRGEHQYDMGMAEFLLRLVRREIRPPLGAELEFPATFVSWREEETRLLDEDGDLEGF